MTTEAKTPKTTRKPRLSAKNRAAIRLLESWLDASDEEAEEQRETFEFLEEGAGRRSPRLQEAVPRKRRKTGSKGSSLMAKVIVLDSGVLGIVTNPKSTLQTQDCTAWLLGHLNRGALAFIPEIADYEVRRELVRSNKQRGLQRLDAFNAALYYEPLTTTTMRHAAQLWAQSRQQGKPTAPPQSLDCDVILCAQALQIKARPRHADDDLVVATTNTRHLRQFVAAEEWQDIS